MSHVATLASITGLLEQGTGDPGLSFDVPDGATIEECISDDVSAVWAVYPVTVEGLDGAHERCLLVITVIPNAEGRIVFRCLAVDVEGEPCAYHEC